MKTSDKICGKDFIHTDQATEEPNPVVESSNTKEAGLVSKILTNPFTYIIGGSATTIAMLLNN